jgi:hypothetical protein
MLLADGRTGTVEHCRCGLVRIITLTLHGFSVSEWLPRSAHAVLPGTLP